MTTDSIRDLIRDYIRDNLTIELTTNTTFEMGGEYLHVDVSILLDGETINTASDYVTLPKVD
jgi:hypothetical protein